MEQSLDLHIKPARMLDLWKVDEQEDAEYPGQVLSPESVLRLNETATLIWKLIDGHHSIQDIIDHLCQVYEDADPQQIAEDTVRLLEDFAHRKLVDLDPDPLQGI